MAKTQGSIELQSKINDICDEHYARGEMLSVTELLRLVPELNSRSTIHGYYKKWKEDKAKQEQDLTNNTKFSPDFMRSLVKELTRLNLETEAKYKHEAQEANAQCQVAIDDLANVESELETANNLNEAKDRRIAQLETELVKVEERLNGVIEAERGKHETIVKELRDQAAASKHERAELNETIESLRKALAKAELKLESNEAYVSEVKEQNRALSQDNKVLSQEIAQRSSDIAGLSEKLSGKEALVKNLSESNSELKTRVEEQSKQLQNAIQRLEAAASEIKGLNDTLDDTLEKLLDATHKITSLEKTNSEQSAVIARFTDKTSGG